MFAIGFSLRYTIAAHIASTCMIAAISSAAFAHDPTQADNSIQFSDPDLRPYRFDMAHAADAPGGSGSTVEAASSNQEAAPGTGGDSVKELSQKSADPTSDIALVFTQFGLTFNDGDHNRGDPKIGSNIVFQPIVPIPLYGKDDNEVRIISRPTIAFFGGQPVPDRDIDQFEHKTGFSDLNLPLPIALPRSISGKWLLAAGPTFGMPTATHRAFGREQWSAGVTGIIGYLDENWMAGAFPQYYRGFADQGRNSDQRHADFMTIFYWFWYNLNDDTQIGWSPTITADFQEETDNKWNVPVGLGIAKMIPVFGTLTRFELAVEYSVVSEDDFGTRTLFKLNIIPIVPRPIQEPIFGGE